MKISPSAEMITIVRTRHFINSITELQSQSTSEGISKQTMHTEVLLLRKNKRNNQKEVIGADQ